MAQPLAVLWWSVPQWHEVILPYGISQTAKTEKQQPAAMDPQWLVRELALL